LVDVAIAYGGELMFEVAIFAMIIYKTLRPSRESGFGLFTVILRDGMYNLLVRSCHTGANNFVFAGAMYFG
jgi:hypothetical protein